MMTLFAPVTVRTQDSELIIELHPINTDMVRNPKQLHPELYCLVFNNLKSSTKINSRAPAEPVRTTGPMCNKHQIERQ